MPKPYFDCVRYYLDFNFGQAPQIVLDEAEQHPPAELWDQEYLLQMGQSFVPIEKEIEKAKEVYEDMKQLAQRFSGTALLFIDYDNGFCTARLLDLPLLEYRPGEGEDRLRLIRVLCCGERLTLCSNHRGHLDIRLRFGAFLVRGPKSK